MITITDPFGDCICIYDRDADNGEPVSHGHMLLLTGPEKRCIRADGPVIINATINGEDLVPYTYEACNRWDNAGQLPLAGPRHLLGLECIQYDEAVQATVMVWLIDVAVEHCIFGEITAANTVDEDDHSVLFMRKPGEGELVSPKDPVIPLLRHAVCVPLDGLLVHANILIRGDQDDPVAKGFATFFPKSSGTDCVTSSGSGGKGKILIAVTWKWSDPVNDDLMKLRSGVSFAAAAAAASMGCNLPTWTDGSSGDEDGENRSEGDDYNGEEPTVENKDKDLSKLPPPRHLPDELKKLLSDNFPEAAGFEFPASRYRRLLPQYELGRRCGTQLVHVFEVLNRGLLHDISGTIKIINDINASEEFLIYDRDHRDGEDVPLGCALQLTAFPSRSARVNSSFKIVLDLSDAFKRYLGMIMWEEGSLDELLVGRVKRSKVPVLVKYAVFSDAIQATVEVWLLRGDKASASNLRGSIEASYGKFRNVKVTLFTTTNRLPQYEGDEELVNGDRVLLPLQRSVVAVPMDSLLTIRPKLQFGECSVKRELVFPPRCIDMFQLDTINDKHCNSIEVKVTWNPCIPVLRV